MTEIDSSGLEKQAHEAHDSLMELGKLSVAMAGIERVTYYPPSRPENDAEHSFHLALSAVEMAANYHPELDTGLVSQFSTVHDMVEVYAGDTPTFDITPEGRAIKEATEKEALERLLAELQIKAPYTAELLERYEKQVEPEARFVRFIDKLLPAIIHSVATDANKEVFKNAYGLKTAEEVQVTREARTALLQEMFPQFEFIHMVRDLVSATSRHRIFGTE